MIYSGKRMTVDDSPSKVTTGQYQRRSLLDESPKELEKNVKHLS
jgi:hypothetical protein